MNRTVSKLLKKLALTNPYGVNSVSSEVGYTTSKMSGTTTVLKPGLKLTYRYLKKFYKLGHFTTADIRSEIAAHGSLDVPK